MKDAHSISTRRAYGVQRVCRVWHRARSSVYARRQATTSRAPCRRRGPVGAVSAAWAGGRRPGRRAGRPHPPTARSLALSRRRVPESLGEAPGRGDPHLAGTGASVDAGARPPGPAPRGPRARPEGSGRRWVRRASAKGIPPELTAVGDLRGHELLTVRVFPTHERGERCTQDKLTALRVPCRARIQSNGFSTPGVTRQHPASTSGVGLHRKRYALRRSATQWRV